MSSDLITVRKGRGRVHLAVRAAPGETVRTLCDKRLGPGEAGSTDLVADCQSCLRRQADPGRVSNAFFESGRGGALLELSLQQARERRTAPPPPPARQPALRTPHFTIVPRERPPDRHEREPGEIPPRAPTSIATEPPTPDLPAGVYRTAAGVVVHVGGQSERPRLERRRDGGIRLVAGDVELEFSSGD